VENQSENKDYVMDSYDQMPTRLEMVTALLTKRATSETIGAVRAYSIRIPLLQDATIKALHVNSGLSQNKVIVHLLDVALDEVFQEMSVDEREAVFKLRALYLQDSVFEVDQPQAEKGEV